MARKRMYSDEIRNAIQKDCDNGMSYAEIARKYGVSKAHVGRIVEVREYERYMVDKQVYKIPNGFCEDWNKARFRVLGIRPGWIDEWNEARRKLLKGARA